MLGNWLSWGGEKRPHAQDGAYKHGNQHLVELRQVVKTYQTAAGSFTALKGVDLQVDGGEFAAVVGKSGSGKSTLINMLTGIDRPTSGQVLVGDAAIHELSEGQLAVWRGRNVGIVFQFFQLLPTLTLLENVLLPMDFANRYPVSERSARALSLLEQVGMAEQAGKLPTAVSGGQQQRVAIARALANDPPIVVADEPTGNLDSKTADAVFALFERLAEGGKTIVMVTHDNDLAARAARSVVVADGRIMEGAPDPQPLSLKGRGEDEQTTGAPVQGSTAHEEAAGRQDGGNSPSPLEGEGWPKARVRGRRELVYV
jgi:putative ABC transport system ATP-binding protein